MVDDTHSAGSSPVAVCPWCSAALSPGTGDCPSCGAALTPEVNEQQALPGLTAIDAAAIAKGREQVRRPRNRLLSWISGEYPDDVLAPGEADALALPDVAVKREMLRLELEAEVANLQAEADALAAEAAAEGHSPEATAADAAAAAEVVEELQERSSDLEEIKAEIDAAPLPEAELVSEVASEVASESEVPAGSSAAESEADRPG